MKTLTLLACAATSAFAQTTPVISPAQFQACIDRVRAQAQAGGITAATFERALAGVEHDQSVIDLSNNQPEFRIPIWDYLAMLVDEERVADGNARLKEWDATLAQAEQRYGVDRHTIVAVWGVESDYGKAIGKRPLVHSLATLSCSGRRQAFFRGELIATLQILQNGDIRPEGLVGSWAGAFGHTQFMPSTFQRLAVDMDGDGRRDIVDSVPDALGSTANFLRRAGWVSGAPWGYEVRLPAGYAGESGRKQKQPLAAWAARGITRIDGSALAGAGNAGLLLPAGPRGPAFLVFRNFDAMYSYNAAESYALAIAHLADRLRGGGAFVTAWPTDDRGLSRAERREVQRLLNERGFDVGTPDGLIGPRTQAAIKAFQEKNGLTGPPRAGGKLLEALRRGKP
ncbi:MAG: lytic murein transglycosylase [Betaproteobacteria bacterium]|nr:lytic murein transglycosylase [Betaproteobacteria bacterium]